MWLREKKCGFHFQCGAFREPPPWLDWIAVPVCVIHKDRDGFQWTRPYSRWPKIVKKNTKTKNKNKVPYPKTQLGMCKIMHTHDAELNQLIRFKRDLFWNHMWLWVPVVLPPHLFHYKYSCKTHHTPNWTAPNWGFPICYVVFFQY